MDDQARQQLVNRIAASYVFGYEATKARAGEILEQAESLTEREERLRDEPELARAFEGRTRKEREDRLEAASIGAGVAHAILTALGQ